MSELQQYNCSIHYRNDESDTVNPVGELQELTQKKLWPPPIYECASEDGQPHERSFTCTVRLFGYMEMGKLPPPPQMK